MIRILLAWTHLLALGIGLGAVWTRSLALRGSVDVASLRRAFVADTWWGVAAGIWLITGLWRIFGSTEKSTDYYMSNHFFMAKMGLFVLILVLEIRPMVTLVKWRRAVSKQDFAVENIADVANRIALISQVEAILVVLMVFAAVAMARGFQ
jgi:putative membrane protein